MRTKNHVDVGILPPTSLSSPQTVGSQPGKMAPLGLAPKGLVVACSSGSHHSKSIIMISLWWTKLVYINIHGHGPYYSLSSIIMDMKHAWRSMERRKGKISSNLLFDGTSQHLPPPAISSWSLLWGPPWNDPWFAKGAFLKQSLRQNKWCIGTVECVTVYVVSYIYIWCMYTSYTV